MPRPRKSSAHITLVLIGAVGLTACSDEVYERDLYASREDCLREWAGLVSGNADDICEPEDASSSSSSSHRYYGPRYRAERRGPAGTTSEPRWNSRAIGVSHVSRGGFGSFGAHFGGGG